MNIKNMTIAHIEHTLKKQADDIENFKLLLETAILQKEAYKERIELLEDVIFEQERELLRLKLELSSYENI